jgi:hypothetical protein
MSVKTTSDVFCAGAEDNIEISAPNQPRMMRDERSPMGRELLLTLASGTRRSSGLGHVASHILQGVVFLIEPRE